MTKQTVQELMDEIAALKEKLGQEGSGRKDQLLAVLRGGGKRFTIKEIADKMDITERNMGKTEFTLRRSAEIGQVIDILKRCVEVKPVYSDEVFPYSDEELLSMVTSLEYLVPSSGGSSLEILQNVLQTMQDAEEMGGPEGTDYIQLMMDIINEALLRIKALTHVTL